MVVGGEFIYELAKKGKIVSASGTVSGDDTIYGGDGIDSLWGLDGNDVLYGGDGDDTDLITVLALGADGDGAYFQVSGGLYGGAGNDYLDGGRGNDFLDGGSDADIMVGGLGDDVFLVDNIDDLALEFPGLDSGTDVVRSTAFAYQMGDHIEYGVLEGSAALLVGNASNNWIGGNSSANTLLGGDGNDTLVGGIGVDKLYGGTGDDTFYFTAVADIGDTIYDFTHSGDRIFLSGAAFDLPLGAMTQNGNFVSNSGMPAATTAASTFLYSNTTGNLFWDSDGTGGASVIFVANFENIPFLTAGDFLVV